MCSEVDGPVDRALAPQVCGLEFRSPESTLNWACQYTSITLRMKWEVEHRNP